MPVASEQAPPQESVPTRRGSLLPLIIGCYQLNEGSSGADPEANETPDGAVENAAVGKSSRSGELRLYMIPSASSASNNLQECDGKPKNEALSFGDAACVVKMDSGVLDGKWKRRRKLHATITDETYDTVPLFASACASGRIHLHALENNSSQSWGLSLRASSEGASSGEESLCLSLAWNDFMDVHNNSSSVAIDQIVSTYSNGTIALHNISYDHPVNEGSRTCNVNIQESHRWNGHTMFGCPSEVWTCSYLRGDGNVVISGADDVRFFTFAVLKFSLLIHHCYDYLLSALLRYGTFVTRKGLHTKLEIRNLKQESQRYLLILHWIIFLPLEATMNMSEYMIIEKWTNQCQKFV